MIATKGRQNLLLPAIAFFMTVTFIAFFHGPIIVTSATQAAQEWGWTEASEEEPIVVPGAQASEEEIPEVYVEDDNYTEDPPVIQLAPEVKASELMARPTATRLGTVPKIFHQSWIDSSLPTKFKEWSRTCRTVHHDYEWVLWTNEDNENLVKKHFPWLLEAYIALPSDIYRADLARNLYMYIFGGVYADLDTDCLRSSNVIFENYSTPYDTAAHVTMGEDKSANRMAFFGRMGTDKQFEHSIPNAWMASTPGHPFFLLPMESVLARFGHKKQWLALPETVTGPVALRQAILKYRRLYNWRLLPKTLEKDLAHRIATGPFEKRSDLKHSVNLLHHNIIYPYSWGPDNYDVSEICWVLQDTYSPEKCKEALDTKGKGSVVITYWSHTHSPVGHSEENMDYITKRDQVSGFSARRQPRREGKRS
ncbi:hypothetical protein BROUX41_000555 [Berkeleyomyces rouxiae]|uniref:uncharacterized protein n=1 Tax=Berkeleyomyces rouxiae TaxID=2035830 RepID=UPI003B7CFFA5